MAELNTDAGGSHGGKHEKKRAKKGSTRVDMTPMVDLAFLLLTFFVLTSTFSKPKVFRLYYPDKIEPKDNVKPPPVKNGITLILSGNNKIYYYTGKLEDAKELQVTDFSKKGLRKVLTDNNKAMLEQLKKLNEEANKGKMSDSVYRTRSMEIAKDYDGLWVLIKSDDKATYANLIEAVDEAMISQVGSYVVVDDPLAAKELELLKKAKGEN